MHIGMGEGTEWSERQFSWHCVRISAQGLRKVTKNFGQAIEIEASRWWGFMWSSRYGMV